MFNFDKLGVPAFATKEAVAEFSKGLRDLVKRGLQNGLVKISDKEEDLGCYGVVCRIGENAFYFTDKYRDQAEELSQEDFIKLFDGKQEELVDEITTGMIDLFREVDEDEGNYYKGYLKECLG